MSRRTGALSEIPIEYGEGFVTIDSTENILVGGMKEAFPLPDPGNAIVRSLADPIGASSLLDIARHKRENNRTATAVIVVSDNTRPVPYRGKEGILSPVLDVLAEAGFPQTAVTVLIGTGTHRAMRAQEIEAMLGLKEAGRAVRVINHESDSPPSLRYLGETKRGLPVTINRRYAEADLKITTGLVESHFMAGASGGRKAICPAIAGTETVHRFHGPDLLGSPKAADMVLDGNPCSEEALEVARMAGCDFIVNVTLDSEKRLTGVFSGDLEEAHSPAVGKLREYVILPLDRLYETVVIPAGYVGVNHYQAAKAAVIASRAVSKGGTIIVVARNTDPDPIGGRGYRETLKLLTRIGPSDFLRRIRSSDWSFVPEQWQTQMWCKVLEKLGGAGRLIYCSVDIPPEEYSDLPGIAGHSFLEEPLPKGFRGEAERKELVGEMVQKSLRFALERHPSSPAEPILLLKDGPYAVPERK
jgi:nickel-dependent lactate racemase